MKPAMEKELLLETEEGLINLARRGGGKLALYWGFNVVG
jgi:hypothetical protein